VDCAAKRRSVSPPDPNQKVGGRAGPALRRAGPTGRAYTSSVLLLPLAACVLLCWAPVVELPAAGGETVWADGRAGPEAPFALHARAAARCTLLVELEGQAGASDLDLEVRAGDAPVRIATSHGPRERLVVVAEAGADVIVRAVVADGAGGDLRLGLTPLAPGPGPAPNDGATPGTSVDGATDPAGERVRLVRLPALSPGLARLRLARDDGPGEVDLLVVDAALDVVDAAETDGPGEDCDLSEPRTPRLADDPPPAWALVVGRLGPARYALTLERPGKGVKAPTTASLDAFLADLARTPDQARALAALRRHPDIVRIRGYLERYPGGSPLRLRCIPGLRAGGIERFGTYTRGTLTINPTIPGHRDNVQELMDTLVHELVHALLDLPRGPGFPLHGDVLDAVHDPKLRDAPTLPIRRGIQGPLGEYLDLEYGPSASDPKGTYSDVNAGAQRLIVKVVEHDLARTGLGRATIVFDNVAARRDRQQRAR
jgi:hypothetical protein